MRWGFLYFHQNFLHLQVEKKYSFASSLRGGSLFSSSSSCQKKRIKNILLHFFKGWVLYFHLNFLLPVTKEEIINKNILLLLLWGGVFIFNLYFLILFPVKIKKKKEKYSSSTAMRGFLYSHRNFLLLPFQKEEKI